MPNLAAVNLRRRDVLPAPAEGSPENPGQFRYLTAQAGVPEDREVGGSTPGSAA